MLRKFALSALVLGALLAPAAAQVRPPDDSRMQIAMRAVVGVAAQIPETARSARSLGTERQGSGVVIGSDGLVLTVGYLILEASRVVVTTATGDEVEAKIVAYDYDTGFGLLRAKFTERVRAIELASAKDLKHGDAVYVAEIDLDAAESVMPKQETRVEPLPRYPSVSRDISILVDDMLGAESVRATIRSAAPPILVHIREFDRYRGKGVPDGKVSLSIRLTFRASDRTLTDAEVQSAMDTVLAALKDRHAAVQR